MIQSDITQLFTSTVTATDHLGTVAKTVVTILDEGYRIGFLLPWIPWLHGAAHVVAEIPLERLQQDQKAPTTRAARIATRVWESDFAGSTAGGSATTVTSLAEAKRRPTRTPGELFRGLSSADRGTEPPCPSCGLVPSLTGLCNCS